MKIQKTALIALLMAAAGSVFAQTAPPANPTATPKIDAREANQEKRIQQGVASGQLTGKEAAHLEKNEARIDTAKTQAAADGVVTHKERVALTKMENHQSRAIARQKHDGQRAAAAQ